MNNYLMAFKKKFYLSIYQQKFILLGPPVEKLVVVNIPVLVVIGAIGVVVDNTEIGISHCWPVYVGGHKQYGVFPFIWHVPPDWQKSTVQLSGKNQLEFCDI